MLGGQGAVVLARRLAAHHLRQQRRLDDDTADGPVTASVRLGGAALPVDPAWVVVAPPNYGPALATDFRTLYDVVYQTMLDLGWVTAPAQVRFLADIFPLFDRLADLQWVNQGFLERSAGARRSSSSRRNISPGSRTRRRPTRRFVKRCSQRFRNPDYATLEPQVDLLAAALRRRDHAAAGEPAQLPRRAAVPACRARALGRGRLRRRTRPVAAVPARLEDRADRGPGRGTSTAQRSSSAWATPSTPAARRPGRCASPRCTRRHSACCIARTPSPATASAHAGGRAVGGRPARRQHARRHHALDGGALADRHGELPLGLSVPPGPEDPYLPTFWAARVPNHVMRSRATRRVSIGSLPLDERLEAFANRAAWTRPIDRDTYTDTINTFVGHIDWPGVVEQRPGPPDTPEFPAVLEVEDRFHDPHAEAAEGEHAERHVPFGARRKVVGGAGRRHATAALEQELVTIEKVRRFPHGLRPR